MFGDERGNGRPWPRMQNPLSSFSALAEPPSAPRHNLKTRRLKAVKFTVAKKEVRFFRSRDLQD